MNFTPTQRKIIAISASVSRFNHPVWFNVLQHLHQNRSWQQEMNHEEEVSARSVGTRILGRHLGWNKRSSPALMIRLPMELLPEWVRLGLWHALRERYKETDRL